MGAKAKEYDYSAFVVEAAGENLMARIQGLAQDYLVAETNVANAEERLAEAKAAFLLIKEKTLPDLLDEAELGESKITTPAGHEVQLGTAIRGSIPAGKEGPCFKWLETNNNGKLIKRTFTIEFGKDDVKWATKFQADCAKRKKPLNLKYKMGVNAASLQAFVKERLANGDPFPMDTFGVYRQRFAKVKVKT